jgi:hypothetical protein
MLKPITVDVEIASGISLFVMDVLGFDGMFTIFDRIVLREELLHDERLIRHEYAHLCQRRRDGWLKFWFFICLWYVWPGYENSPYEIEARQAEESTEYLVYYAD